MRVPTCAYDACWGAYATISPSFGHEIVALRMRTVFGLLGWDEGPAGPLENGISFAGMEMPVCSSQRTEYRSQAVLQRCRLIPANRIPFSNGPSEVSPHPSEPNTVLKGATTSLTHPSERIAGLRPRPHLRQPLPRGARPSPSGANLSAQREGEESFSSPSVSLGGARAGAPPSRQSYSALMEPSWPSRSCAILIPCM